MPFCSNCGAPVEGRFCTKCGSLAGESAAGGGPASEPARTELSPNVAAALCYVPGFVIAIIFLLWAPYNRDKTIRFHAFQSIFLQVCWIVTLVVLGAALSVVYPPLWYGLERLCNLAAILLIAFMIWKTWRKEEVVLPYLGPLAQKQA